MSGIVLDLCGGTGSWSKPWKDAGYDVRLVTLPDYDVCTFDPPLGVVGILAAPPCTEFSLAKADNPRDFNEGMLCVEACMRVIWECRKREPLKFWAVENPRGFLRQFLGLPAFSFEHWWFGDPQIKPTDLWGYFRTPRRTVKERPTDLTKRFTRKTNGVGWSNPKVAPEFAHLSRAAKRAMTPPGFAKAFYKANR